MPAMTPDKLWEDLVTVALVGTERQAPALPPPDLTPLTDTLAALPGGDVEATLLGAAAVVATYRRAGCIAPEAPSGGPEAVEAETLASCGPRSAAHLELLLGGQHKELLPEWLAAAAGAGKRAPEPLLPALLDLGRTQKELRPAIASVAGKRGAWLAGQNPDWSYLAGEGEEETAWEAGSRAARVLLLQRLREADPRRGRELLESTWEQETGEDRAAFIGHLKTGLSMEDEPFLEAALDDRRKQVRSAAADLLARLPGSRLVRRMRARVEPLLSIRAAGGLLGIGARARLEVKLPEAVERDAVRDGVEPKKPSYLNYYGERAYWLMQMLSVVPPSIWSSGSGGSPAVLIEAAKKTEWKDALLEGWSQAAVRHRDAEWAQALISAQVVRSGGENLLDALSPAQREVMLLGWLQQGAGTPQADHMAMAYIQQCRHPWSDRLSRAFIRAVRERIGEARKRQYVDWSLQEFLRQSARFISPQLLAELSTGWPENAPNWELWQPAVSQFLSTLRFRQEMIEEISR